MSDNKTIKNLSFEQSLAELEEIVKKIDTGQEDLASAVDNFERGVLLKKHCEDLLQKAKLKIDKIIQKPDGSINAAKVEL